MNRMNIANLNKCLNEIVLIKGWIHRIRKLKSITFLVLRDRTGMVQCVIDNKMINIDIRLESVVSIKGKIVENNNKLNSFEIEVNHIEVISEVHEELPIEINKENLDVNLDTMLNNRVLSLRHDKKNGIIKIQSLISQGFREFLIQNDFTEIFTPKIVSEGAEGGTELFNIDYFGEKAYLAQSPQFYKQMMVAAGFERVFEIGFVYRAEEHNTNRHLNEYVSMDLEIGFIENEEELMDLEEELLRCILNKIERQGEKILDALNITIPIIEEHIPRINLNDAIEILKNKYNKLDLQGDLDPEGERLIGQYVKDKYKSEFVFITNYPKSKRPMYTMPLGNEGTHSFDLLFRGLEVTTGGQRIHDYDMLINNIKYKELNPENYKNYTKIFKYGMPPHGGLAIGLERLTCQLLNIKNVREAAAFPRDRTRITP